MTPEQEAFLSRIEALFGKAHADNLRTKLAANEAEWFIVDGVIKGVVDRE